jgi:hypothetical protein
MTSEIVEKVPLRTDAVVYFAHEDVPQPAEGTAWRLGLNCLALALAAGLIGAVVGHSAKHSEVVMTFLAGSPTGIGPLVRPTAQGQRPGKYISTPNRVDKDAQHQPPRWVWRGVNVPVVQRLNSNSKENLPGAEKDDDGPTTKKPVQIDSNGMVVKADVGQGNPAADVGGDADVPLYVFHESKAQVPSQRVVALVATLRWVVAGLAAATGLTVAVVEGIRKTQEHRSSKNKHVTQSPVFACL